MPSEEALICGHPPLVWIKRPDPYARLRRVSGSARTGSATLLGTVCTDYCCCYYCCHCYYCIVPLPTPTSVCSSDPPVKRRRDLGPFEQLRNINSRVRISTETHTPGPRATVPVPSLFCSIGRANAKPVRANSQEACLDPRCAEVKTRFSWFQRPPVFVYIVFVRPINMAAGQTWAASEKLHHHWRYSEVIYWHLLNYSTRLEEIIKI